MGTSYQRINEIVIDRLSVVFDPPCPKLLGKQPSPRYAAMVQVYLEALEPFSEWELEAGVKLALETHKYQKWPKPAEMRQYAFDAKSSASSSHGRLDPPKPKRDRSHLPSFLQKPAVPGTSQEQRRCDYFRLQVFRELQRANKLYETGEHGEYVWTPAAVSAEGDQRYQRETGREPPKADGVWW